MTLTFLEVYSNLSDETTFTLTVTDPFGRSSSDDVVVNVVVITQVIGGAIPRDGGVISMGIRP